MKYFSSVFILVFNFFSYASAPVVEEISTTACKDILLEWTTDLSDMQKIPYGIDEKTDSIIKNFTRIFGLTKDACSESKEYQIWSVKNSGSIQGLMVTQTYFDPPSRAGKNYVKIHTVMTAPKNLGVLQGNYDSENPPTIKMKGAGKVLLNHIYSYARANNLDGLYLFPYAGLLSYYVNVIDGHEPVNQRRNKPSLVEPCLHFWDFN